MRHAGSLRSSSTTLNHRLNSKIFSSKAKSSGSFLTKAERSGFFLAVAIGNLAVALEAGLITLVAIVVGLTGEENLGCGESVGRKKVLGHSLRIADVIFIGGRVDVPGQKYGQTE